MSQKQCLKNEICAIRENGCIISPTAIMLRIVALVHDGKKRRSERPVLSHVFEVASGAMNDDDLIVALGHDVVEDSLGKDKEVTTETWTPDDLKEIGIPAPLVGRIDNLTRKGEPYFDYITRIWDENIKIKQDDLTSNSGQNSDGRQEKYDLSYAYLTARKNGMPQGTPFGAWMASQPPEQQNWKRFVKHSSEPAPPGIQLPDNLHIVTEQFVAPVPAWP